MKPKVVTFDCANTLVRVRWTPGGFALDCAREIGLELGDAERAVYERSLRARWGEYRQINESRNPEEGDAFWRRLTVDWLAAIGQPVELADRLMEVAPKLLYEEGADQFELFDDVLPVLDRLEEVGIRTGVISNWDYSLHRVLQFLGVHHRFDHVVASLEEGVEKPDPRLFLLTLEKFGIGPGEALHVGDDPLDDLQGAKGVGMSALLVDRSREGAVLPYVSSLSDLLHHLA